MVGRKDRHAQAQPGTAVPSWLVQPSYSYSATPLARRWAWRGGTPMYEKGEAEVNFPFQTRLWSQV